MGKTTKIKVHPDFLSCCCSCHGFGTSVIPISRFYSTKKGVPEEKDPQTSESYLKQFSTFIKTSVQSFSFESKVFYRVYKKLWKDPQSVKQLSRRDIQIYSEFSKDLPTFGVMVVVVFVPMAMTICLPLMFLAPQYLLSHHFWTQHQKVKFGRINMRSRLQHGADLIKEMNVCEGAADVQVWSFDVNELLTKVDLTPTEILSKRLLFEDSEDAPFKLDAISPAHLNLLLKINSLSAMSLSCQKARLVKGAMLLQNVDLAMQREGIKYMTHQELAHACVRRGLHPEDVIREEMIKYLTAWVKVSSKLQESSISLLLHLPVLLGHNAPSNTKLLHSVS